MKTTLFSILCLFLIYELAPQPAYADARLAVAVSILPQKYFVEKIGKRFVDVSVVVPEGVNPTSYEPHANQILSLSLARIYFATGAPFEQSWLNKIKQSYPDIQIVEVNEGIHLKEQKDAQPRVGVKKSGSKKRTGEGVYLDTHTWLSPPLAIIQARNILTALVAADPSHSAEYRENFKDFAQDLIKLDFELMHLFSEVKTKKHMLVSHAAWGYFADAYNINMISLEVFGKEPSNAQLQELINKAKRNRVKVVFVQTKFPAPAARHIAKAIGAQVVEANAFSDDWEANIRAVAKKIAESYK